MGSELRSEKLSLAEELEYNAHQFSFEMAAYILEYHSDISFGREITVLQAPFKTISINSFCIRGTEIEKIKKIGDKNVIYIERLAIAGLNAPLPTPYSELMLRRAAEKDTAMKSFVNIFNSRLLGVAYRISKRRYLCLQNHNNENCMLIRCLAALFGDNPDDIDRRLSRLSYLFWTKEKSAAGLEALISSVFRFDVKVNQFHPFWADICENNILGFHYILGKNSGLGKRALISSFGVEVELKHTNYEKIYRLLTDKQYINKMKCLIQKYLGDFFSCHLSIQPETTLPLVLSTHTEKSNLTNINKTDHDFRSNVDNVSEKKLFLTNILGRTSWLPSSNSIDAVRVKI